MPPGEWDRYSTKPSPSMSPYSSIHRNAASAAGKSFWAKSRSPVHRKCWAYRIRNHGVASTEPKYGVWGTNPALASSPWRTSWRLLPGCCSRQSSPRRAPLLLPGPVADLPGLPAPPVIDHGALAGGQELEGLPGRLGVHREELVRGDQRIASEDRHVPGDSGGQDAAAVGLGIQGPKVPQAAVQRSEAH